MDVAALKSQIKSGKIKNFMIFAGDEWEVQQIYIQQISKITGLEQKRADTFSDIVKQLRNKSFVNRNYLYILRDDKDLMTNERLWSNIQDRLGNNILILLVTTLDKRLKFYTRNKSIIIEFQALQPMVLKKYIQKQIVLSDKDCEILIDVCESNYGRILLEIDKIRQFSNYQFDNTVIVPDDRILNYFIQNGIIYRPPKDVIFDLVEAILKRQAKQSFDLLEQSYAVGESTMVILSVLFANAKAVLQVQTCESKEVSKVTGLTGWQIMNATKVKGNYSNEELEYMLHLIRQLETGIKIGKIEDKFVMEYLLVSIL